MRLRVDSKFARNLTMAAVFSWATVATVLGIGGFVSAQDTTTGQYKIAVVDRKAVFDQYTKKQTLWTQLESERTAAEKDLNSRLDDLQKQVKDYEAGRDKMPEDQRTAKENDLNRQRRQLQADSEAKQNEINRRGESIIKEVTGEINKAIQEIGRTENYHLILESDTAISSVVFSQPSLDITGKVVARVNGGAAPAQPAAPAKKKP